MINQKGIELIRKFRFATPTLLLNLTFDHDIGKMAKINQDEYYKDELVEIYKKNQGDIDKFAKEAVKHVHDLVKDVKDTELQLLKQFKDNEHVYKGKSGATYEHDQREITKKFERIEEMIDSDLYNICLLLEHLSHNK
jgi:hypothetical protein